MKKIQLLYCFLLLFTITSNAQWVQLPFEQENLESLYFKDADTGYVGTYSTDETLPKLFKTADGGMNWTEISLPDIGSYTKITTIHFFDDNTGFLTTDDQYTSLRTTDGGQNWTSVFCGIEETYGKAYFKNDGTGFYYADIIENNLFYTDDMGATWSFKGDFYLIHDIQFLNNEGSIGYMFTEWSAYKTVDNGNTWNGIFSWEGPGNIFFYNEDLGFLGTQGGIYKTSNGGDDWDNTFFYPGVKIFFINENIGFNISVFYNPPAGNMTHRVYKTLDSGETWQEMYKNNNTEIMDNTKDFSFPENTTGYAITNNKVYKLDVTAGIETVTKNSITIHPIPATNVLNITNNGELLNCGYSIINLTGKVIFSGTLSDNTINVASLKKGLYFLKIGNSKPIKFFKN